MTYEDLDRAEVRLRLVCEIRSGFLRYIHVGLPSGGWASVNKLNGGVRRCWCPDGAENLLPREQLANFQARYVVDLCIELVKTKGWFTIENPWASHFWKSSFFSELQRFTPVYQADVAQCSYGLRLPGASHNMWCLKRTCFFQSSGYFISVEGMSGYIHETSTSDCLGICKSGRSFSFACQSRGSIST